MTPITVIWQGKSWTLALRGGELVISDYCGAPFLFKCKRIAGHNVNGPEEHPVQVLVTVTEIKPAPKRKRKGA